MRCAAGASCSAPTGVEDLAGLSGRQVEAKTLPRVILVVDEFHEIFSEEDQIGAEAANMLDRLLRQGRAFGVHAAARHPRALAGHEPGGAVTRSMLAQIAVRIALQCSADDSRLILAEDNPAARAPRPAPGRRIYNAANGRPDANERFQVVWLPDNRARPASAGREAPLGGGGPGPTGAHGVRGECARI